MISQLKLPNEKRLSPHVFHSAVSSMFGIQGMADVDKVLQLLSDPEKNLFHLTCSGGVAWPFHLHFHSFLYKSESAVKIVT